MHVFEGMDTGVKAMQFLQRAQNIGKVVISQPSTLELKPESHYVLSGGMGALGMVTAQYLLEEGAKSMTLLSRSGRVLSSTVSGSSQIMIRWQHCLAVTLLSRISCSGRPSADITELWAALQDSKVELQAAPCDIGVLDAVQALAKQLQGDKKQTAGLIHLAAVLDDATMPKLTRGHLERSYGAKVWGARHLRFCLQGSEPWDFALLFSSTSALLGSPGQGNYSAANAALDGHARYWKKSLEEPVVSVQWGPWKEVGMAAQKGTVERLRASGVGSLTNAFGMAALAGCLRSPLSTTIVAQPMRWAVYLKQYPKVPPFLSRFASEVGPVQEPAITRMLTCVLLVVATCLPGSKVKTAKPKKAAAPTFGGVRAAAPAAVPQVDKAPRVVVKSLITGCRVDYSLFE